MMTSNEEVAASERNSSRTWRRAAKIIAPFWIAAVVIGSFLPSGVKVALGTKPHMLAHPIEFQHRLAHFGTFGMTAVIFLLTAERRRDHLALAVAAFLLGFLIEIAQVATHFSTGLEWWDVRDDFYAAAAGLVVFEASSAALRFVRGHRTSEL